VTDLSQSSPRRIKDEHVADPVIALSLQQPERSDQGGRNLDTRVL
jgi:hypothetical protein